METEKSLVLPKRAHGEKQKSGSPRKFCFRWLKRIGHGGSRPDLENVYFAEPSFVPSVHGSDKDMHVQLSFFQTGVASM
ncbi:hypothetical protein NDN08_007648 [Rhodosorus marinus]|uniref:Uncharacterized protein n=1 Tax=Rhodosorus marinus TaxID=101924 RepID=A0AAV8V2D0_9RHOD|nr:hypothetical protein NDN08_007648 [Rhodosorus marinus]